MRGISGAALGKHLGMRFVVTSRELREMLLAPYEGLLEHGMSKISQVWRPNTL